MIDPQTAREGAALLSTAIAELMEDTHGAAVFVGGLDMPDIGDRAVRLRTLANDMSTLAGALEVLGRRQAEPVTGEL